MYKYFSILYKYEAPNKPLEFILQDGTCVEITKTNYKNEKLEKEWLPCKCNAGVIQMCPYNRNIYCSCSGPTYMKVLERTYQKGLLAFSYSNLYIRYIAQSIENDE